MTEESKMNPSEEGSKTASSAHGTAGAGQGSAAAGGFQSSGFEGSIKQASDINTEEALAVLQAINPAAAQYFHSLLASNAKRTYDLAQSTDLAAQLGDAPYRNTLNNLATQALQNAIETANMVSKQAVRHSDIAIDRQWNPDEQGWQVTEMMRTNIFKEALEAAVAKSAGAAKK